MDMEYITGLLGTFSTWAISATAIIAALSAIIKPFRKVVSSILKKLYGSKDDKMDKIIKEINDTKVELKRDIESVSNKTDRYARENFKDVIFGYGNRARHKEKITGEQFRRLQEVFQEYVELGGNDIAHDEYNFIVQYYNDSGWKKKEDGNDD